MPKLNLEPRFPELRNPLELALYLCLVIFTAPTAVGRVPLPGSLAEQPDFYGMTAAWLIVGGCAISSAGLLWRWDRLDAYAVYQAGCIGLSWGCILYAVALYLAASSVANIVILEGILAGLWLGLWARWFQVNRWWRRERKKARKILGDAHA